MKGREGRRGKEGEEREREKDTERERPTSSLISKGSADHCTITNPDYTVRDLAFNH